MRLAVYDDLSRAPFKIHSEGAVCNLGSDLTTTGRLNPAAAQKALASIRRFSGLMAEMKVKNVRAVATAAVRDAKDGKKFAAQLKKECGIAVKVIDGGEEARLSAAGVLTSGFCADGVIGDYGGGSLELIVVKNGRVTQKASLPLGSHRLLAKPGRPARISAIDEALGKVAFLKHCAGRDFYAMGGSWRFLATAHMHRERYPLRLLDRYQVEGKKAAAFAARIARQSPAALEKTFSMTEGRARDIGVAALAMERLFKKIRPRQIIFSAAGLREGLLFDLLTPATRRQDALISSCAKIASKTSRLDGTAPFKTLFDWMLPIFPGHDAEFSRLLEASCLLSDGGWLDHENYQAGHAFERVLTLPFYGIDHGGRVFLALSQYVRYRGCADIAAPALALLDKKMTGLAVTAGLAQRLGYLLTGGALEVLRRTELRLTPRRLALKLDQQTGALNTAAALNSLQGLAAVVKRNAMIEGD